MSQGIEDTGDGLIVGGELALQMLLQLMKGYPQSAPFAMAKFALRGLIQSMAPELAPWGIHVALFVIDGAIRPPGQAESKERPDTMLDPDAIAALYLHVLRQPRGHAR